MKAQREAQMLRTVYLTTEPPDRTQRMRRSVRLAHDPLFTRLGPASGDAVGAAGREPRPQPERPAGEPLAAQVVAPQGLI
jgi:hypothetical protein